MPWTRRRNVEEFCQARSSGVAPVRASEDVRAGGAHGGEERRGVHAEVDDGDAEGLDAADERGGGGEA